MTGYRLLSRVLLILTAALALPAVAAVTVAARSPETREHGPTADLSPPPVLLSGFDADTLVFDGGQLGGWFTRMHRYHTAWVRIPAVWSTIAPTTRGPGFQPRDPSDPQYRFGYLDGALRRAAAAHLNVLLDVAGAPTWAEGSAAPSDATPGTWRPSATAFGDFAHALATRYSGTFRDPSDPTRSLPAVHRFQAWNEPNVSVFLAPQWVRNHGRLTAASPKIYRALLNAFYGAIVDVQPRAYILAAGLAPYGDAPGGRRMHPVTFARDLTCLNRNLRPRPCPGLPHADAFDIHPYATNPAHHAFSRDDVAVPDIDRLARVVEAAEESGHVLPRGEKTIWSTELGYPSSPPLSRGPSLATQARSLSLTFWELWRQGVAHVMWYAIEDPTNNRGPFGGTGLFFRDGRAKPAARAFAFPFVAQRGGGGSVAVWGRTPAAGRVTIERSTARGWQRLFAIRSSRTGIFSASHRIAGPVTLRARSGSEVSVFYPVG